MKRRKVGGRGLTKMRRATGRREVLGWKHKPSGWFPEMGLDHVIRRGKELEEYSAQFKKPSSPVSANTNQESHEA